MNQLHLESSPYLLQHKDNPVHWHAWNDAALARARAEDKPILVSIGYATCHWCHVMERESFEDEATAAVMNEHFVCIKVDREERPDVDKIYMEACQAINGSGGWPLNAFLLPDGRPFYAGTYYPPEAKYNRPSWRDVLHSLSTSYSERREEVEEQAERLTKNIAGGELNMLRIEPEADDHLSWRNNVMQKLRDRYDHQHGGFGGAPKFPGSQSLEALLAHGVLHGETGDIYLARHGMLAMLDGGIYDQLGGGFSRYTVDGAWRVPHFEKMLYDNALLLRLLAKLQMTTPDERFRDGINETITWLKREMLLPSGGYRAGLDADSEGVEGKYYVWQQEEIEGLLSEQEAAVIIKFYGITEAGNWAEEHTNIPYRPLPKEACATALDISVATFEGLLTSAKSKLHTFRFETRVHPGADDKVILQWNALLVSAFTWCYRATGDVELLNLATELWDTLRTHLFKDGRWHRNYTNGHLGAPAFLDDLAALTEAAIDLYAVTFDMKYLIGSDDLGAAAGALSGGQQLVKYTLENFGNNDSPMLTLRQKGKNELPVESVDLFDNALPSGNSQFMHSLLRMSHLLDEQSMEERGEAMLAAMAGSMERYPGSFAGWVHAALLHAAPKRELVVTGPDAVDVAQQFLSPYRPGLLLAAAEEENQDVSLFRNRYLADGLRFYLCENQVCQKPVTTAKAALELLEKQATNLNPNK
ncbi:thioredoxin domain-containing protein [Lewinella sp. 4G2]|uniref:thioredoxin domain-containing protein n=1 Tax=Lewinella sp. 4G2 TaxID=1803372 RepID=UPI0007E051E1|nr:thioredoxin domain-containing protein [Lewinella sp. 4G2]OAV46069.1 hypothetical protein A3850_017550 [Lewinella sp. 4G2]